MANNIIDVTTHGDKKRKYIFGAQSAAEYNSCIRDNFEYLFEYSRENKTKCVYCGQYGKLYDACEYCGAPIGKSNG